MKKGSPEIDEPCPLTPALSQWERESMAAHDTADAQSQRIPQMPPKPSLPGRGWHATPGEGKAPLDPELLAFARQLRQESTDTEQLLWSLLRDHRFFGLKFRRQHPLGRYVLDFYCHKAKLAVELDGVQHNHPKKREHDNKRTAFLKKQGIQVLRFWNHDVLQKTEVVLKVLFKALTPTLSHGEREMADPHSLPDLQNKKPSRFSTRPSPSGRGWRVAPGEGQTKKLLVIDNYDSFTYNLVQLFRRFDLVIEVFRSDQITLAQADGLKPDYLLISPGPKDPAHAGLSIPLIDAFYRRIPVLGVCLGMQCINELFGGQTIRATLPMHGKTSAIHHDRSGVFEGLPSPFNAARYHSLMIEPGEKTEEHLMINARTDGEVIMGVAHNTYPLHGVQFHPESFLTQYGFEMAANFLKLRLPDGRAS